MQHDYKKRFEINMYNQFWNNVRRAEESTWKVFLSYSLFIGILTFLVEYAMPNIIIIILIIIFTSLAITMSLSANLWFVRNMYLLSRVELQFEPYEIVPQIWIPLKIKYFNKEIWLIHSIFYLIVGSILASFFYSRQETYSQLEHLGLIIIIVICVFLLLYFMVTQCLHLSKLKKQFNTSGTNDVLKKIAIDVDSTLIDIMVSYCQVYNELKNETKTKDDVRNWDFFAEWNLSNEEGIELFDKIDLHEVPVICDEVDCYLLRFSQKHLVDIVTNRKEMQRNQLVRKLESMGLKKGINYNDLIIVNSDQEKVDLNYDIYIDDGPKLALIIESCTNKIQLMLNQPWNQEIKPSVKIKKFNDWEEIYNEIIDLNRSSS